MSAGAEGARIITFYSYKGGTGRSMALANVAWILAGNGKRVLAVDWDLEAPGLHRYFHPFLPDKEAGVTPGLMDLLWDYAMAEVDPAESKREGWREKRADVLHYAVSLRHHFSGGGFVDLLNAGRQDRSYAARVSAFNWSSFYERLHGGAFLDEVRRSMRANYDYVLIDSRTGLNDASGICTVHMPDILVVCLTMNSQSIAGALAVTDSVLRQRPADDLTVLPVPMRVEDGESARLEAARSHLRAGFRRFLREKDPEEIDRYWGDVEIPYKPFYAYEEILAAFGDRPHQEGSLLAAYERLTARLTGGEVREAGSLGSRERVELLQRFLRPAIRRGLYDFFVGHAAPDLGWAEWIATRLERAGYRVFLAHWEVRPGARWADEVEDALLASDAVIAVLSPAAVRGTDTGEYWRLAREADPGGVSGRVVPVTVVDCTPPPELRDIQGVDLVGEPEDGAVRLLLETARRVQPPAGDSPPHRRDRPRPRFPTALPEPSRVPARPRPFVGRDDEIYELWSGFRESGLRCQVLCGIGGIGKSALAAEFAHRFAGDYDLIRWTTASDPDPGEFPGELSGRNRCLLVFEDVMHLPGIVESAADNVEVLVTSRLHGWPGVAEHHLGPLATRAGESLARTLHGEAHPGILARARGLPLALVTGDDPLVLVPFWLWARNRLSEDLPAAVELMYLLAAFAPDAVPWETVFATPAVVEDPRLRAALTGHPGLLPAALTRYHLVERVGDRLVVHPMLRAAIRAEAGTARQRELQRQVDHLLTAVPLGEASDPAAWPGYEALLPHVLACDWAEGPALRTLVLRFAGYLTARGRAERARALSRKIFSRFRKVLGAEHPETLAAMHVLSCAVWAAGDTGQALDLAQTVLLHRADRLGDDHPDTLAALNNVAVLLCQIGRGDEALSVCERVVERRSAVMGDEHPHTVVARGNLAAVLFSLGRYDEALAREREVHEIRRSTLGERHPVTLASWENIAAIRASTDQFLLARDDYRELVELYRDTVGPDHPETMRATCRLGAALIRTGEAARGRDLLRSNLVRQRAVLGDHPDVAASERLLKELTDEGRAG